SMALYDPRIVLSLFISFLGFRIRRQLSSFEVFYLKIFIVGAVVLVAFSEMVIIAWRGSYYFLLNGVIVVPFVAKYYNVKIFKGSNLKMILSTFVLISYGIYLSWLIYQAEPFKFFVGS
ncbi:hypothetical protein, partial [Idiomarina sp.]|uniref:hypothetical protein n=1 Tax=Idiomarina sp. TaxID=1874361 RepID=UPI0025891F48